MLLLYFQTKLTKELLGLPDKQTFASEDRVHYSLSNFSLLLHLKFLLLHHRDYNQLNDITLWSPILKLIFIGALFADRTFGFYAQVPSTKCIAIAVRASVRNVSWKFLVTAIIHLQVEITFHNISQFTWGEVRRVQRKHL